ncbi:MAG: histidine kinase dimerization/phosphoacceptor domain-containing protein, partial [Solirubrobacteraceae bacterium]
MTSAEDRGGTWGHLPTTSAEDRGGTWGSPPTNDGDSLLGRHGSMRVLYALVWLVFLLFPLIDAINSRDSPIGRAFAIVAAAVFVGVYVRQLVRARRPVSLRVAVMTVVLQLAIAITLTLAERYTWGSMFTFAAAGAAFVLPPRLRPWALLLCGVLVPGVGALDRVAAGEILAYTATTVGVGLLMLVLSDLRSRNAELLAARAELARLAVAQERLRFARDLHDLLGHTLSVIALKSELAGRLLPDRASEALEEVRAVERVARGALAEVREAVGGYR